MPEAINIVGQRFGRLVVVNRLQNDRHGKATWECRCDCGTAISMTGHVIRRLKGMVSCGCHKIKEFVPVTQEDIAYAAGFFDGEGAVMIYFHNTGKNSIGKKSRRHHRLFSTVCQVDPRPLLWLKARFGGTVTPVKASVGTNERDRFNWVLQCAAAANFLKTVKPYLILKSERVDLALAFQETMTSTNTRGTPFKALPSSVVEIRDEFRAKLMKLNKRGVA